MLRAKLPSLELLTPHSGQHTGTVWSTQFLGISRMQAGHILSSSTCLSPATPASLGRAHSKGSFPRRAGRGGPCSLIPRQYRHMTSFRTVFCWATSLLLRSVIVTNCSSSKLDGRDSMLSLSSNKPGAFRSRLPDDNSFRPNSS